MTGSNFNLVCKVKTDGDITLSQFVSKRTGLTVFIGEVEGPVVNGYLALATEAHDDDGLPHTLEHLCFMGSENYPYKGVLDLLANRCLASGTNAWTDIDHTCYTMTTAGHEGFLNLLPIYLDHVLFPTLTDEGFLTEVHHINGEGEDAGVVYCEMQGRENTGESRCHLAMLRAMYPGYCGYKSETGGIMKNLRESTSNEKIRKYHKAYYRPENLYVIITGQVPAEKVFEAILPIEEKIISKGERPEFIQPWQTPVPPLENPSDLVIQYPCDDDDNGLFFVAWRGPRSKAVLDIVAVDILMEYLTCTSVSPLQKAFIEIEDPYCSEIDFELTEAYECCLCIQFHNVQKEKLYMVKEKLFNLLRNIATGKENLDMKRLNNIIHRKKLNILNQMESSPHDSIAHCVIRYFLFGNTVEDLQDRVQQIRLIDKLSAENSSFWMNLLKKYAIDGHYVVIVGEPSPTLMKKMMEEEKERINQQRVRLCSNGLIQKAEELEKAMNANDVKPPDTLITSVPVPSVNSISFHEIKRESNYENHTDGKLSSTDYTLPYRFHLDDLKSNFVTISVLMDTSGVPQNLKLYLPLYFSLLLESPILRNGKLVPHEEIVKQLEEDTVSSSTGLGLDDSSLLSCGSFAQVAELQLKVEVEKYERCIQWLRELLFQVNFTASRIRIIANKIIKNVAEMKRAGRTVTNAMIKNMNFKPESNHWVTSMLRQQAFLNNILKKLDNKPEEVTNSLEKLRGIITNANNITVHMATNVSKLSSGINPWPLLQKEFIMSTGDLELTSLPCIQCYNLLRPLSSGVPQGAIAGIGSVESSFLVQSVESINSYLHPDLPSLYVLIQYLTQLEGPMWRRIRGKGLSYGYNISIQPNKGSLFFVLVKSSNIISAYKEAKDIVESHLSGTTEFEPSLLESARSSLMYEIIESETTVPSVSLQSMLAYYRGINMDYTRNLLELISKVSVQDVKRVGPKYLTPLFDTKLSRCAVCCNPSKINEIVTGFKEMSRDLFSISLENSFLSTLHEAQDV